MSKNDNAMTSSSLADSSLPVSQQQQQQVPPPRPPNGGGGGMNYYSHSHHPQHHHHHHHPNDNVVDYYAMVGIGDTLEFQSITSSSSNMTATAAAATTTTTTTTITTDTTDHPHDHPHDDDDDSINEDEMERFLREIIRVDWIIVMVEGFATDAAVSSSSTATATATKYQHHINHHHHHNHNHNHPTSIKNISADRSSNNCSIVGTSNRNSSSSSSTNMHHASTTPLSFTPETSNSTILDTNLDWYYHYNNYHHHRHHQATMTTTTTSDRRRSFISQNPSPIQFYLSYQRRRDFIPNRPTNHNPKNNSCIHSTNHRSPTLYSQVSSLLLSPSLSSPSSSSLLQCPAIADLQLFYVRIPSHLLQPQQQLHRLNVQPQQQEQQQPNEHGLPLDITQPNNSISPTTRITNRTTTSQINQRLTDLLWKRCTTTTTTPTTTTTTTTTSVSLEESSFSNFSLSQPSMTTTTKRLVPPTDHGISIHDDIPETPKTVPLASFLTLPSNFHEWCIPSLYEEILCPHKMRQQSMRHGPQTTSNNTNDYPKLMNTIPDWEKSYHPSALQVQQQENIDRYCYIPVVAIRQQSISNEQRYYEDAALTDIRIVMTPLLVTTNPNPTTTSTTDHPVLHPGNYNRDNDNTNDDDDDENDDSDTDEKNHQASIHSGTYHILGQTKWTTTTTSITATTTSLPSTSSSTTTQYPTTISIPTLQLRRNRPNGFCDLTYTTRVIGRFPYQNYDTVPLPLEEIPMFCYPKLGSTLYRTQYSNVPLVQYYGFVVKNERGDSIYVSCVSFMEPLTTNKMQQLEQWSYQRRFTSLPHYQYYMEQRHRVGSSPQNDTECTPHVHHNSSSNMKNSNGCLVTAFTDMTTFENKTICLISRYPYWTAFRKFLLHLHMITTSAVPSTIPMERYISHLLLSVQLPRPGGPNIILPLPALTSPIIFYLPHEKDLPLLDLPFHRLFSCLSISTIVTIVLGLLSLERKVIILSTNPALVLDVAELLRSLLFPFELCAPYVPRLTEPFKSSLGFPGAIFVGIHDDGDPNGLAAMVKTACPEDSTIINLDTGEMDCDGDRHEMLSAMWNIIPHAPRTALVNELEALCRDADIVDGQEALESLMDSAYYVDLTDAVDGNEINMETKKSLDDRGIRDAFLRFFCSVLGGYERFLVVPDANFLISGEEWFDAPGFLASVPSGNTAYLTSLVSTQLFQSFIQRRTEASDIHCMLFDECLIEFHSSPVPYGRLGGDVEAIRSDESSQPQMLYSLLVDQSATLTNTGYDPTSLAMNRSMDASEADSSFTMNMSRAVGSVAETSVMHSDSVASYAGDLITMPSLHDLPPDQKYMYCIDGNPCFPHNLNPDLFLPREPSSWSITLTKNPDPLLARSERELEEANRRRRVATSQLGVTQRRCVWQLPKLLGSHFLGAWLLCTPALVSQAFLSHDQQSKYLLRALGALRLLRSRHRIIPDEAAYRALLVACGRTHSDRRVELVKLFGLMRSDGIFPSAVTLGQYTKALAEGYSKRISETYKHDENGVEVTASQNFSDLEESLNNLDTSLHVLEHHGRRWQQRSITERGMSTDYGDEGGIDAKLKRMDSRTWHPVVYSSSFIPRAMNRSNDYSEPVRLLALWSRTRCCTDCSYIPLEEEIQAGWDTYGGKNDIPAAIGCPRCDAPVVPMLAFREMSIDEALNIYPRSNQGNTFSAPGLDFHELPPQIGPIVDSDAAAAEGIRYVTYINPSVLRDALEHYVEEYGDSILNRDQLRDLDLEVFVNFWWYCARFSLPLPLPTSLDSSHMCAFAAWDRSTAERGCYSAAKAIQPLIRPSKFENDINLATTKSDDPSQFELFDDVPLLSRFNLQGFYSNVWDHPDLSKLLVSLVEACDKRDFRSVVENAVRCNKRRLDASGSLPDITLDDSQYGTINSLISFGGNSVQAVEFDVYRVVLYLAKYQCTSAFHSFFPTTLKPCKGYHFWCAIGTPLPTFDRLFRDAMRRVKNSTRDKYVVVTTQDLTDIALAFRCVFGHLI